MAESGDKAAVAEQLKEFGDKIPADKKGAIDTAKLSLAGAEKENNGDYVKMNKDSILEWSKK